MENPNAANARKETRWGIPVLLVVALWLWIFWPLWFSDTTIGYRDTVTLYRPMMEWMAETAQRGEWPGWSAREPWGASLAGESVAGLYYPGQWLLWLPLGRFLDRFHLYLTLHVLGACGTAMFCARRMGAGVWAATFAGISYGFGGSLLFQVTNPIYLVGGMWLPLALAGIRAGARSLQQPTEPGRGWCLAAIAIAMMILAGDPQMAYLSLLVAAVTWGWSWRGWQWVLGTGGLVASLAAVQILPSLLWARQSERMEWNRPRSIWEAGVSLVRGDDVPLRESFESFFGRPEAGTHHEQIYQFSQPPWTAVEWLWPGVSGTPWPENSRWMDWLPGTDRMWQPSLYQGGLVLWLVLLVAMQAGQRDAELRWWLRLSLFFLVAAWGWYGAGWVWRELTNAIPGVAPQGGLGEPVGGLYWLLVTLVPGMAGFRYPAKLMVIVTLGLAILSARAIDGLVSEPEFRRRLLIANLVAAVLAGGFLIAGGPEWLVDRVRDQAPPVPIQDHWFGSIEPEAAIQAICQSVAHALVGSTVALLVLSGLRGRGLQASLLVLLVLDLGIAQPRWLPVATPAGNSRTAESERGRLARVAWLEQGYRTGLQQPEGSLLPGRPAWRHSTAAGRLGELSEWLECQLFPRLHWTGGWVRLESFSPVQPAAGRLPELLLLTEPTARACLGEPLVNGWGQIAHSSRLPDSAPQALLLPRIWLQEIPETEEEFRQILSPSLKGDRMPELLPLSDPQPTGYGQLQWKGRNIYLPVPAAKTVATRPDKAMVLQVLDSGEGWIEVCVENSRKARLCFPEGWSGEWIFRSLGPGASNRGNQIAVDNSSDGPGVNLSPGVHTFRLEHFWWPERLGMSGSLLAWLLMFCVLYRGIIAGASHGFRDPSGGPQA